MKMNLSQILEMISINRDYIQLKSQVALQNLPMLHSSFDHIKDESCIISLALNDSFAAAIFEEDYEKSISISKAIIARYPHTSESYLIAFHEAVIGRSYTFLMRLDEAEAHLRRAESLAFRIARRTPEVLGLCADILHRLAMIYFHKGTDMAQAVIYLDTALGLLEDGGSAVRRGMCYLGLGNIELRKGHFDKALPHFTEAKEYFDASNSHAHLSAVLGNIGLCYIHLSDMAAAEAHIMRGLDLRTRLGSYGEIAAGYYNVFLLHEACGDMPRAREALTTARDYAQVGQAVGLQRQILDKLIHIDTMLGDMPAADAARQALTEILAA